MSKTGRFINGEFVNGIISFIDNAEKTRLLYIVLGGIFILLLAFLMIYSLIIGLPWMYKSVMHLLNTTTAQAVATSIPPAP